MIVSYECTKAGCSRRRFMDSDRCFDHQSVGRGFRAWFIFVTVLTLAMLGFGVWVVVQLVEWVTAR